MFTSRWWNRDESRRLAFPVARSYWPKPKPKTPRHFALWHMWDICERDIERYMCSLKRFQTFTHYFLSFAAYTDTHRDMPTHYLWISKWCVDAMQRANIYTLCSLPNDGAWVAVEAKRPIFRCPQCRGSRGCHFKSLYWWATFWMHLLSHYLRQRLTFFPRVVSFLSKTHR